jgi:hypothetical protein
MGFVFAVPRLRRPFSTDRESAPGRRMAAGTAETIIGINV